MGTIPYTNNMNNETYSPGQPLIITLTDGSKVFGIVRSVTNHAEYGVVYKCNTSKGYLYAPATAVRKAIKKGGK